MFENSVVRKSGQWWKLVLSFMATIGGGVTMSWGLFHLDGESAFPSGLPIFIGMLLVMFGFIFACTSIRCSKCGARWFWLSVKGQSSNQWLAWLLSQSECPLCKGSGGVHAT